MLGDDPLAGLTSEQLDKLRGYYRLLLERNRAVNLVSRSLSPDDVWAHIVHCLELGIRSFPDGARVVDWGSGGGLPAIPLAIIAPNIEIMAIEATGKKVRAIADFARVLSLDNVSAEHVRAEDWRGSTDYSVSRATAPLSTLWGWHAAAARRAQSTIAVIPIVGAWVPGLVAFKGGDIDQELRDLHKEHARVVHEAISLGDRYRGGKLLVWVGEGSRG